MTFRRFWLLLIVEISTTEVDMATVNFSVPDEVKAAFDRTFKGQNKSAVIADLMRKAVDEAKRRKRREDIFRSLTEQRRQRPSLSNKEIRSARTSGRP
ncbi:MAG: hypothetical protein WD795_04930 [Woeseia sp.]